MRLHPHKIFHVIKRAFSRPVNYILFVKRLEEILNVVCDRAQIRCPACERRPTADQAPQGQGHAHVAGDSRQSLVCLAQELEHSAPIGANAAMAPSMLMTPRLFDLSIFFNSIDTFGRYVDAFDVFAFRGRVFRAFYLFCWRRLQYVSRRCMCRDFVDLTRLARIWRGLCKDQKSSAEDQPATECDERGDGLRHPQKPYLATRNPAVNIEPQMNAIPIQSHTRIRSVSRSSCVFTICLVSSVFVFPQAVIEDHR
jgi:hypothetical protein